MSCRAHQKILKHIEKSCYNHAQVMLKKCAPRGLAGSRVLPYIISVNLTSTAQHGISQHSTAQHSIA